MRVLLDHAKRTRCSEFAWNTSQCALVHVCLCACWSSASCFSLVDLYDLLMGVCCFTHIPRFYMFLYNLVGSNGMFLTDVSGQGFRKGTSTPTVTCLYWFFWRQPHVGGVCVGTLLMCYNKSCQHVHFPECCLPGVQMIPAPNRSILHATRPSQLPFNVNIWFGVNFSDFRWFPIFSRSLRASEEFLNLISGPGLGPGPPKSTFQFLWSIYILFIVHSQYF